MKITPIIHVGNLLGHIHGDFYPMHFLGMDQHIFDSFGVDNLTAFKPNITAFEGFCRMPQIDWEVRLDRFQSTYQVSLERDVLPEIRIPRLRTSDNAYQMDSTGRHPDVHAPGLILACVIDHCYCRHFRSFGCKPVLRPWTKGAGRG